MGSIALGEVEIVSEVVCPGPRDVSSLASWLSELHGEAGINREVKCTEPGDVSSWLSELHIGINRGLVRAKRSGMCTGPEYSSMAEPFCLRFVVSKLHRGGELIGSEVFSAAIFFILVLEKMGKNLFVE